MQQKDEKNKRTSFFWRWFLNNKIVTSLLIILLCLLIIFMLTKLSAVFKPFWEFIGVVGLPLILSGLLYYILNPIVDYLEKRKIKRIWGIILLFILIVVLFVWGAIVLVPKVQNQLTSFIENVPAYWEILREKFDEITEIPIFHRFHGSVESSLENLFESISHLVKNISLNTVQGIGSFVGTVTNIVLAVVTTPFILFYLLKDGKKLPGYMIQFVPTKARCSTRKILSDINKQVSQYVRGQLLVALTVGILFGIGFSIIGLDYAITLGILAGFLNLIPYLGSFLAAIPAVLLGIIGGPFLLIKVAIVFTIEQTIEGRLVSPLVLGNKMDIHPVTIVFILLTSGKLFGIAGMILGIPVYAAFKVVILHLFEWYKQVSHLYEEENEVNEENS